MSRSTERWQVAVELPEKQGLKLMDDGGMFSGITPGCSGTSRKTRIETTNFTIYCYWSCFSCSGTSRKIRIETQSVHVPIFSVPVLQWNFQKNKD